MKHVLSSLLVATALVAPAAFAQTTATTKPVGYESVPLAANQYNVLGLRLQAATVATDSLETIGTNTVTDNDVNFQSTLTANKIYLLELTSGNLAGLVVEVTAGTGNNLNTIDDLSGNGVTSGTTYVLRPALTLNEIFGDASTSVLAKGVNLNVADNIWVPDGSGGYNRYYLSLSGWRTTANADASNMQVTYTDGILVQKRGAAATLTVSGEVKTAGSRVPIINGTNVLSTVYPAGVTLQNLGLEDDLQKGVNINVADVVLVPNGSGDYDRYFMNLASTWINSSTNQPAAANLALPPGVLLLRKGAAKMITLTPPSSYSGL